MVSPDMAAQRRSRQSKAKAKQDKGKRGNATTIIEKKKHKATLACFAVAWSALLPTVVVCFSLPFSLFALLRFDLPCLRLRSTAEHWATPCDSSPCNAAWP